MQSRGPATATEEKGCLRSNSDNNNYFGELEARIREDMASIKHEIVQQIAAAKRSIHEELVDWVKKELVPSLTSSLIVQLKESAEVQQNELIEKVRKAVRKELKKSLKQATDKLNLEVAHTSQRIDNMKRAMDHQRVLMENVLAKTHHYSSRLDAFIVRSQELEQRRQNEQTRLARYSCITPPFALFNWSRNQMERKEANPSVLRRSNQSAVYRQRPSSFRNRALPDRRIRPLSNIRISPPPVVKQSKQSIAQFSSDIQVTNSPINQWTRRGSGTFTSEDDGNDDGGKSDDNERSYCARKGGPLGRAKYLNVSILKKSKDDLRDKSQSIEQNAIQDDACALGIDGVNISLSLLSAKIRSLTLQSKTMGMRKQKLRRWQHRKQETEKRERPHPVLYGRRKKKKVIRIKFA